jgi:predicted enzyme related to lactoylglutathione lyase
MKRIGPIIEIILYVADMDSQVRFYRDVLGLCIEYPKDLAGYSKEMWVTFETGMCCLALHGGGKRRLGPDTPKIVFSVEEMAATRQDLVALGVEMGEIRTAAPGILVCDGKDPEGNPFSIESRTSG